MNSHKCPEQKPQCVFSFCKVWKETSYGGVRSVVSVHRGASSEQSDC